MTHDHGHGPSTVRTSRAFLIGIALNLCFVAIEATFGALSHSMALLADAGHNLSDVLGLALSWAAMFLARRKPSARRTHERDDDDCHARNRLWRRQPAHGLPGQPAGDDEEAERVA